MMVRSITMSRIHESWCNSHDNSDIKGVILRATRCLVVNGQSLLIRSYRLALDRKIILDLSNMLVVRDFPNIFSEVSLGRHLTAMLSWWSSWFSSKPLFSPRISVGYPELVG